MALTDIGIDLGAANTLVYVKGKGVVFNEPTVAAYDKEKDMILQFGNEARALVARSNGRVVEVRPIRKGTITDYPVTEQMIRFYIEKAMGHRMFLKPNISICLPAGITKVESRAVEEAVYQSGARDVTVVKETVAAAIGAGIDVTKPFGNMIADIGSYSTSVAVISMGDPVLETTVQTGGDAFGELISRNIRKRHGVFINETQAEEIKRSVGTAYRQPKPDTCKVTGRDVMTGLVKAVMLTSEEVRDYLTEATTAIEEAIHGVLEKTPPELVSDISSRGIVLTGGGALLSGLPERIEERTGINVMLADNPSECVAIGTGKYLETLDAIGRMVF